MLHYYLILNCSNPSNSEPEDETKLTMVDEPEGIRLQKVLAAAGLGSRRKCEELIAAGRVTVDGVVADALGRRVDPATAVIHVDGARVNVRHDFVYLALNKPLGVLSAMSDDRGRPTVADLVHDQPAAVFHVGRLDADTEGLLLLTNDGDLGHRLMHPSFEIVKVYVATVAGEVRRDVSRRLTGGIELEDGAARADSFRVIQTAAGQSLVEIALHEGRNRIVRRMMDEVGHPVLALARTAIGPVRLGGQPSGTVRELSRDELAALYALVDKKV